MLLLDKPLGLSSNAALMHARRALGGARAGHGGTLDPLATGLLPLLFGEATKFAHGLLDADKSYLADVRLGICTETGDAEGAVRADRRDRLGGIDALRCDAVLERFVGDLAQVPPMHSALKRDGKPLYAYARAGETVERAARSIRIHRIERVGFDGETLRIRVDCSKGTYIRVLAEDIGEALGCGGHLSALRRERVGSLSIDDAIGLEALAALDEAGAARRLAPIDALLGALDRVDLPTDAAERFAHGQRLRIAAAAGSRDGGRSVRVYGPHGLVGVARLDDGLLAPVRLVASGPDNPSIPPTTTSGNPVL